jgi:hypothetical protein
VRKQTLTTHLDFEIVNKYRMVARLSDIPISRLIENVMRAQLPGLLKAARIMRQALNCKGPEQ